MGQNDLMDELPGYGQTLTVAASSIFVAASLVLYGNGTLAAFGYDLAEWFMTVLFEIGGDQGLQVTYAHAISLLSIGAAYVGTTADLTDFTNHQGYLGVGLVLSVLLPLISAEINTAIMETTTRQIVFVGAQVVAWVSMVERIPGRGWI